MDKTPPPQTLAAIGDLLAVGKRTGIGITFMPDANGWTVGYMVSMGGGDLASAFDLHTATVAAFRPLLELIDVR
jgi:hypothetical protein